MVRTAFGFILIGIILVALHIAIGAILIIVGVVLILIRPRRQRIVKCVNCGFQMTYRRWIENNGCIKCGTDLYIDTGRSV